MLLWQLRHCLLFAGAWHQVEHCLCTLHMQPQAEVPTVPHSAGVKLPAPDYEHLTNALKKQCSLANQQPTDYFLLKVTATSALSTADHAMITCVGGTSGLGVP
jgi:hypothetical protein